MSRAFRGGGGTRQFLEFIPSYLDARTGENVSMCSSLNTRYLGSNIQKQVRQCGITQNRDTRRCFFRRRRGRTAVPQTHPSTSDRRHLLHGSRRPLWFVGPDRQVRVSGATTHSPPHPYSVEYTHCAYG